MSNEEFEAFLRYLADEYLEPRIHRVRERSLHHMGDEIGWSLERLRQADQILRVIQATSSREDIHEVLTEDALRQTINDAQSGLRAHNRLAEDSGLMEILDEYFIDIACKLRGDHLPSGEAEILTALGFPRAAAHLPALVYTTRLFAERQRQHREDLPVSHLLNELVDRLEAARQPEAPRRKRKWWTGLGEIVTGTVVSIADIGLGVGLIPIAVPAAPWVAIGSSATGVGQILKGIGAIRGE